MLVSQCLQTSLNRIVKNDVKRLGVGSPQLSGGFKPVNMFDLQRCFSFYVCARAGRVERPYQIADVSLKRLCEPQLVDSFLHMVNSLVKPRWPAADHARGCNARPSHRQSRLFTPSVSPLQQVLHAVGNDTEDDQVIVIRHLQRRVIAVFGLQDHELAAHVKAATDLPGIE